VGYRVQPAADPVTGTEVTAQATADFDFVPLGSGPFVNTLDGGAPSSAVALLAEASIDVDVLIAWSGTDDADGIGIAGYDIYVSDNGGPFTLWLDDTTATSAVFTGEKAHTYDFYSIATDLLGNAESPPLVPDASVHIRDLVAHTIVAGKKTGKWTFIDSAGNPVEVSLIGDNITATVYRRVADDQPGDIVTLSVLTEYGVGRSLNIKTVKGRPPAPWAGSTWAISTPGTPSPSGPARPATPRPRSS
jgi:hypothetical protein